MGEESDHVHITALSDALSVPIRIVYLDRSSCDTRGLSVNHHDFIPATDALLNSTGGGSVTKIPFITLLYRPGHYDILYTKWFLAHSGKLILNLSSHNKTMLVCVDGWGFFCVIVNTKHVDLHLNTFVSAS